MQTIEQMKADAKRLRSFFKSIDITLSVAQSLEAIAAQREFRDWNTALAAANKNAALLTNGVGADAVVSVGGLNLTLEDFKKRWANSTVMVTADMDTDEVREELDACLKNGELDICVRIDAAVTGTQLRSTRLFVKEYEANKDIRIVVDSPL